MQITQIPECCAQLSGQFKERHMWSSLKDGTMVDGLETIVVGNAETAYHVPSSVSLYVSLLNVSFGAFLSPKLVSDLCHFVKWSEKQSERREKSAAQILTSKKVSYSPLSCPLFSQCHLVWTKCTPNFGHLMRAPEVHPGLRARFQKSSRIFWLSRRFDSLHPRHGLESCSCTLFGSSRVRSQ